MEMRNFVLVAALAATTALAQQTTVKLWAPDFDNQSLVASVITASAAATTYFVTCAPSADDCGLGPGVTMVGGPSTYAMTIDEKPQFYASTQCSISQRVAVCTIDIGGPEANDPTSGVETATDVTSNFPLTVTAGAEKLSAAATATGSAGSQSSVRPSATVGTIPLTSTPSSTGSSSSGTAGSSNTTPSSTTSKAGVPRITQNAALAGLAALAGGAMMM